MMQGGGGEVIMHVGGGGGGGDGRRNNDDPNRDGMKQQPNKQLQQHPQQPQKCPRCESINTKFCYYNNYSLTQPRYFCKNCRRYWTQGGTLRNVPVGGGCRKGKRPKMIAAGSSSAGAAAAATSVSTVTASTNAANTLVNTAMNPPPGLAPFGFGSYNFAAGGSGGGFLSSLAAVQSFAHPGAVGINIGSADLGGGRGGGGGESSSFPNLGLLVHRNFNTNPNPPPPQILPPNFGAHHQHQPITRQFYHLSAGDQTNSFDHHQITNTSTVGSNTITSSLPAGQQHPQLFNWPLQHQGLMLVPDTSLWSISTTATAAANTATTGAANSSDNVVVGSSGHQWNSDHGDHLPGYGPS